MKRLLGILFAVLLCITVTGCGNASKYNDTVFDLDYESDESQDMSEDRASSSKLKRVFTWLDGKDDRIYDLTYEDVASRVGCHASSYSNLFGSRHYVWDCDGDGGYSLGISCDLIGGEWAVTSFSENNYAT